MKEQQNDPLNDVLSEYNLTFKQEIFCQAVFQGKNYSDAYREAYNTDNMKAESIHQLASRLGAKVKVRSRISGLQRRLMVKNDISIDRVAQEYARIAFANISDLMDSEGNLKPIDQLLSNEKRCIKEITKVTVVNQEGETRETLKITLHDKLSALDKLAKHIGFYEPDIKDDTAKTTKSMEELEAWFQYTMTTMKKEQAALKGRGERIEAEIEAKINRTQ